MPQSQVERVSNVTMNADLVDAVLEPFGEDAVLYAVDHATDRLVRVSDGDAPDEVDIADRIADVVFLGVDEDVADVRWTPLRDRRQTVYVVRSKNSVEGATRLARSSLGMTLSNQRHRFEDLERPRRRASMSVAAELQWDLLPVRYDALGRFEVASVLEPAYEVAGDLFDYSMSGPHVWAYSLDGMGHGVEATITGVLALSAIRNARREGASLTEQMDSASSVLWEQYGGERFVTGVGVRIGPEGDVDIVNAGHEPIRAIVGGETTRLDLSAQLPLGVSLDQPYRTQTGPTLAAENDAIVLLSDGPASARSSDGEVYGAAAIEEAIGRHATDPLWSFVHGVMDGVLDFIGDGEVNDDMTMVSVRRRGDTDV